MIARNDRKCLCTTQISICEYTEYNGRDLGHFMPWGVIVTVLCRLRAQCHSTCIVHPYYFTPFKDQICFLFILKFSSMSDSSLHPSSPIPTPLCFGFHCLWYNITSTSTFMDNSQFKQFYWCRNPPTCRKSLTNYITKCCIKYTSPCSGFELTTPAVVIGTDCTCSCKSNYNMITTTTARNIFFFIGLSIFLLCCT